MYKEPDIGVASQLAHESRTIKAKWDVKNGPETFLVHRHYGAAAGPPEARTPGVEYPGKWGAQVDDGYRFKKRPGPQKYFQNASDHMGGGSQASECVTPLGDEESTAIRWRLRAPGAVFRCAGADES